VPPIAISTPLALAAAITAAVRRFLSVPARLLLDITVSSRMSCESVLEETPTVRKTFRIVRNATKSRRQLPSDEHLTASGS
jgi:hypothetical protein